MINFRYHIVSLMAVFLALAVGIVAGVSLGPSVKEGLNVQLNAQAEQDRLKVVELRAELDQANALAKYRDAYATRVGPQVTAGALGGFGVAVVVMPDAPSAVVTNISEAVGDAGGTVVRSVKVDDDAFDAAKAEGLDAVVEPYQNEAGLEDSMTAATRFGRVLGWSIGAKAPQERDQNAVAAGEALQKAGFATFSDDSSRRAELIIVVTAPAPNPQLSPDVLQAHVQTDVALLVHASGVVVAGPDSENINGTDVLAVRSDSGAAGRLSTVDVADLPSGVTTTVLAGQQQLLGQHGHYGALAKADAPLPTLPVR
ncbi:copper transporter [uncultured Friedmanniella sp.]|uniref:copper transporter n=1 Tax=uncultured Friedmanniella sp. TaxID=335381 RepID=UPI0035CAFC38